MCYVATNLVTSLKLNSIRCATTLCHFGRTRNGYVATYFILLSSTAESSATSGYVVVSDVLAKMKNQLVEMRNGLRKNLILFRAVDLTDATCTHVNMNFSITFMHFILFTFNLLYLHLVHFFVLSFYGKSF